MGKLVEPIVAQATPEHVIGSWNNVSLIIWRGMTDLDAVDLSRKVTQELGQTHSDGVGLLTIIEKAAPMPPGEARSQIAEFFSSATYIKASAVAFEGEGFRAGAVRSVVAGLTMLARQPFPHKIFATLKEATDWQVPELRKDTNADYTATDLWQAVTALRLRIDEEIPRAAT